MNQVLFVRNNVVKGFGRGSKQLGCPTANVGGANKLDLSTGIYCGLVQLVIQNEAQLQEEPGFRQEYEAMLKKLPYTSPVEQMVCSFGYNPQFGNKERSLEVHILNDYKFNFYGAEIRVLICNKMREEEKYNSLDELKQAIANDINNARREVPKYKMYATKEEYFIPLLNNGTIRNGLDINANAETQ